MKHLAATLALGPFLMMQGRHVRRVTPVLPEPPGPREGVNGDGAPLRLLILGDSAAAGVGAATQTDALSGQLVAAISPHFQVSWRLHARTGATTSAILRDLRKLYVPTAETYDVVGECRPRAELTLLIHRKNGETLEVPVTCRLDTAEEVSIYEAGGVLQRFAQDFLEAGAQDRQAG